jgi:hypothetical protein
MYLAKPLVSGSTLTTSAVVYYTAPTGTYTRITQISVTNTDSSPRIVDVYIATGAGAPATVDQIIKQKTLAVNETWVPYQALGVVLSTGQTLQAKADANSVVVLKASGIELS